MKKSFQNVKVDFSEAELSEINTQIAKFDIFFTKEDFALLKKYALDEVVGILKHITEIRFTKDGTLEIDLIYQVIKLMGNRLKTKRVKNPFLLLSLMDRLVVVLLLKLNDADNLTDTEKYQLFNTILGSITKTLLVEGIKMDEFLPKTAKTKKFLRAKLNQNPPEQVKKKRITVPQKLVYELQKQIGSKCPFCDNDDVAHFDTHHIDENPSNNNLENLLRLCKICHSKITKGDISRQEVIRIKNSLN
ncbi:MAG: nuclease [Bacteroidetes bacterium]|nr:nuclease [Bacteroidota bacterium]